MAHTETTNEAVKKVAELIKDIKFAMMTTVVAEGTLHSHPMGTQGREFDGTLYFLTGKNSHKLEELRQDSHVNIAYANPDNNQWVSVAGTSPRRPEISKKIDELWSLFH